MQDSQSDLETEGPAEVTDYVVPKPASLKGYALHRLAEGLTGGGSPQFTDFGDYVVVRTAQPLAAERRPIRIVRAGQIVGFELRACVGKKVKGHHRYFPLNDWRSRHQWLARQGDRYGFEVVTVHCSAAMAKVEKGDTRFTIDQTDFTGILKVTDIDKFALAIRTGVGSTGRAFGFGMLNI